MFDHLQDYWPALVVAAGWLARETRVLWHGGFDLAEYFIAHGGIGMWLKKLVWNPKGKDGQ